MSIIEKIKAEIERRSNSTSDTTTGRELDEILSFLSTLESEKQIQDELEKEINRLWESFADEMEGPHNLFDIYARLARHFAKWGADHTPLPEDTVLFQKGVEEGKRLMMENAVKWLVDDDYHEALEKGRFILGSVGLGYNGYYIPYLDLLKLPRED